MRWGGSHEDGDLGGERRISLDRLTSIDESPRGVLRLLPRSGEAVRLRLWGVDGACSRLAAGLRALAPSAPATQGSSALPSGQPSEPGGPSLAHGNGGRGAAGTPSSCPLAT
eukprot:NODE_4266_length_691_cov_274.345912.p3 GENE.NODE_4266_length_691_cov_274.345912~~NODE_4266_length_691_cov_274.345912.p3  ORF type:complete len:112 (-),score=21.44 NODE_4266_length_691_cov_274.345912:160-495(-)